MKNAVSLIGRIGQDATTKEYNGKKVTHFSLATTETYKDKSGGEKKENTEWHKCTLWGHEGVLQYLVKGKLVSVDGKIKYGHYERDVNGEKVTIPTTEINIDSLLLLPSSK